MNQFILALDQGTTSSRAIVFDRQGLPVASAQQEFPQILPAPGIVEHDPEAIWSSQLKVARQALAKANITAAQVAAIGIANQRETTIIWERATGRPVSNAVVWQSRVSSPICERLSRAGLAETFRGKTGLVIDAYFSATKIAYLLDTIDGLRSPAEAGEVVFGTVDTWLLWRLTGGKLHITDASNASRTLLYNIHTLDWDDELLTLLKIPRAMLPEVRQTSEVYGHTDEGLFGGSIAIGAAAGDQQAATFGQACFAPGDAKNTYGTGCFLLVNTGSQPIASRHKLLTTIGWRTGGETTYCLEGSVFVAGAAVQWLRDGLGLIKTSSEVEQLAATVPDAGGVYLVPAFVGLGAPHWDSHARGTIVGISRGTTAGHLARAALDSMAYQSRDLVETMEQDIGSRFKELKVDGGASVNDELMQFQADQIGVPVKRPAVPETTALGAAYLAGLAVGYWSDLCEIERNWALGREFIPAMPAKQREALHRGWKKAVDRARHWEE
ncbi:MAG TPA: glycerol kinase GlpK [Pirellulales bacterium]|nr:glycerol kinase GlpK [Pirellulales bacterium]